MLLAHYQTAASASYVPTATIPGAWGFGAEAVSWEFGWRYNFDLLIK
jgi:hypothetical protein